MDKKEVLKQIKAGDLSLEDVDKTLRADKEVVLAAVKQDGFALDNADKKLKADKEVVITAVKQDGYALEYADKKLLADKEVVLAAVEQNGLSLYYANKKLQADKEVVLAAVNQDADALEYADKKVQKEFKTKNKKSEEQVLPEICFSCPELTYYDLTVEEKDLNSIEKIRECLSDVISDGENESTAYPVLGKLKSKKINKDYVSIESSDEDIFDYIIENQGRLIENPKRGQVVFIYFYYYDHAVYILTKNKNFKNICFKVKSFNNEAIITELDYSGFELTENDASGGGELQLQIICSNGQLFEGTVAGKEDLIEKFNNYLTEKKDG